MLRFKKNTLLASALLAILAFMGGIGCTNYRAIGNKTSNWIDKKEYQRTLDYYDETLKDSKLDQLLYLMDKGIVLQMAGRFEESKKSLFAAERLADELDAISVTTQAGSMLTNDESIPYKGEDYEKVMINVFNAFNFMTLQDYEGALIECKRANEKMQVLQQYDGQRYQEDPFVSYLTAVLYQKLGQINDAYIDYKRVFELRPDFPYLKNELIGLASQLGFSQDLEKWESRYASSLPKLNRTQGQLVVFYAAGKSPEKIPHQARASSLYVGYAVGGGVGVAAQGDLLLPVPRFKKRPYQWNEMKIWNEGQELAQSYELENLVEVGFQSLRDRLGREVARSVARLAVKAKAQDEIRKNFGDLAGLIAGAGFILTQRADTRSWLTLPASLQVARVHLNPGTYDLQFKFYNKSGTSGRQETRKVVIERGKLTLLYLRTTD